MSRFTITNGKGPSFSGDTPSPRSSSPNLSFLTPSQLNFLEEELCQDPAATIAIAEGGDHGEGEGCGDSDPGGGDVDRIHGTNGPDDLEPSNPGGPDALFGLNGDDTLNAGPGRDQLFGGNDADLLDGGPGRDRLRGGNGDDELRGGRGRDLIYGDQGNDLLIGGCGPDLLKGGPGNDVLYGGNSPDIMIGGPAHDVFVLALSGEDGDHGGGDHGGGHGGGHSGGGGHDGGSGGHETDLLAPTAPEGEDGHDGCTEGIDVVTDFKQGTDVLALAGGLSFDDLNIVYDAECRGTLLFVVSGHDHEMSMVATSADDHGDEGRRLAFLEGFSGTLTEADFLTCNDLASMTV